LAISLSTDYVLDGKAKTAYKENYQTNPQGVYVETKLNGELSIKTSGCKYIVIITAWVFSEYGNNFLKTMLRLGTDRDELSIVVDQMGCPTYAHDMAKSLIELMRRLNSEVNIIGTYHFVGEVGCPWADIAQDIFKEALKQGIIKK